MQRSSGRVLVLGEDTRSFLSIVRSLGRRSLEVHAAWCALNSPSLRSRYLRKVHRLPRYRYEDRNWLDGMRDLLERERFDLVIPSNDASLLPLQRHRAALEMSAPVYLLADNVFDVCFSKKKTHALALDLGIRVPDQREIHSPDELKTLAAQWGYPLVIKPPESVSLADPFSRQAVTKIKAAGDIPDSIPRGPLLVEQNFIGYGIGVEVLCWNGEVLTALEHERVHEPLGGGGSSYRRTVPLDADLFEATRTLMRAVSYTGVAMVEFKRNRRTGAWALIEINARFWGSLPLSLAAGIDFPRYLYEMLCLGRREFPRRYRHNVYCRNWLGDLYWFRANLAADRTDPTLMTAPLKQVAREALNPLLLRERSDTFVLDDPAPALSELFQFGRRTIGSRVERIAWARRVMRRKAQDAVRRAQRVLFLCRGNICRSPFAARLLSARAPEVWISESAGFYPVSGRRAPDCAAEAAGRFGIDLRAHRSQTCDASLLEAADVILTFDRQQRMAIEEIYPEILPKVHYLAAFDPDGALDIPDPYGGGVNDFLDTYRRIEALIRLLVFESATMRRASEKTTGA